MTQNDRHPLNDCLMQAAHQELMERSDRLGLLFDLPDLGEQDLDRRGFGDKKFLAERRKGLNERCLLYTSPSPRD